MARQKNTPTADELNWIGRFLRFANHPRFTTQRETYEIFYTEPHPFIVYVGDKAVFQALPESASVEPFTRDQKEVRRILKALANRDAGAADRGKSIVGKHLGRILDATMNVRWKRGELRLDVEPKLTGMEACIYYPLALIFQYGLDRHVKICGARVGRKKRYNLQALEGRDTMAALKEWEKDEPEEILCGAFYVAKLNGAPVNGCSVEHGKMVTKQGNVRRVRKHRRRGQDIDEEE
jgi:hypothetical protein